MGGGSSTIAELEELMPLIRNQSSSRANEPSIRNIEDKAAQVKADARGDDAKLIKEKAKGVMDLAKALKDNRDNLKSEDPLRKTAGLFAVSGTLLACGGPVGASTGAFCALAGAIMGLFMKEDGGGIAKLLQQVLQQVVNAFKSFKHQELLEEVMAAQDMMQFRIIDVERFLTSQLTRKELQGLSDLDFLHLPLHKPLRSLTEQIKIHARARDKMAEHAAEYVVLYAQLGATVKTYYSTLATLYGAYSMAAYQAIALDYEAKFHKQHSDELKMIFGEPDGQTNHFYRALHFSLTKEKRVTLMGFLDEIGVSMTGRLCRFFNPYQRMHLAPWNFASYGGIRGGLAVVPQGGLFRVFGPEHKCTIFSVESAAYMYASFDHEDGERRNVCTALPGNDSADKVYWDMRGGKLRSVKFNEYFFASDENSGPRFRRVYTWHADKSKYAEEKGLWKVEDISYLKSSLKAVSMTQSRPPSRRSPLDDAWEIAW